MGRLRQLLDALKRGVSEAEAELGTLFGPEETGRADSVDRDATGPDDAQSAAQSLAREHELEYRNASEVLPRLDRTICGQLSHEF